MKSTRAGWFVLGAGLLVAGYVFGAERARAQEGGQSARDASVGREVSLPSRLAEGSEYALPINQLIRVGRDIFTAKWTSEEGGGRPLSKGSGGPLADLSSPLLFPRNFNRVSGPDANACGGCHNDPLIGGAGERATGVFVTGQRFDFATFDFTDAVPTRGAVDEHGLPVTLQTIANERKTTGLSGSGFIELLARHMTFELQRLRNTVVPGGSVRLKSKGVSFGTLARRADGTWDTSGVEGLHASSLASSGAGAPPSLLIRPWFQSGVHVSLRQFSVSAFNHHHGMQAVEAVGYGTDPDGDGVKDEMTRADIPTATLVEHTLLSQRFTGP